MLAKIFASDDWMSAVQIARKVWDEKTAMEQLTILAEAMDMGWLLTVMCGGSTVVSFGARGIIAVARTIYCG